MSNNLGSDITPRKTYATRKEFLKAVGVAGVSAAVLAACQDKPFLAGEDIVDVSTDASPVPEVSGKTDELGDALTSYEDITNYNNFYEFTTDKEGVAKLAKGFISSPWEVKIGGLVENPLTLSIEEIRERYEQNLQLSHE